VICAPVGLAARLLGTAILALGVAGCLVDAPTPAPSATPTLEPTPTARVDSYRLATTVWYGGMILTFERATSTLEPNGGAVAVEMTLANPGPEELSLGGPIRLVAGDRTVEPGRDSPIPSVPAAGTVGTTVTFRVDGDFDVPSASVVVGRAEEHRAIVPFVPDPETPGAEAVTL